MIRRSSHLLGWWFLTWDLLVTSCAWVGAYVLRVHAGLVVLPGAPPTLSQYLEYTPLLLVLAAAAYRYVGMYEIHRLRRFREELASVAKGTGLLVLLVLATVFFRQDPYESRLTMLLFAGLGGLGVLAMRRVNWGLIRYLRSRGYNRTPALIVGTGRIARKTATALQHASWTGMYCYGFIEDRPSRWTADLDVVGTSEDLPRLIEKKGIRNVFICLPLSRFGEARQIIAALGDSLAEVRLVVDAPTMAPLSLATTNLEGLTVINLRENPHYGLNLVMKRTMDIVLSLIGIILLAPLMLLIAAIIKLTSRGPVFYRQERCGLNGERFQMLKFRTMRVDAEAETGPVWATQGDRRRTTWGAFLRKTSLDELPQLFNVLWGDMSLVGPRPERPFFIERFRKTIPHYMARHQVKAGITGWAQVNGWRGNTSLRKRVQHDLYYITHWNPWFDLRILWLTIFKGFRHKNAC